MSGDSLRVLLVHRGEDVPSARIRMLALAPWLEKEGARVDVAPYPTGAREWRALFPRAADEIRQTVIVLRSHDQIDDRCAPQYLRPFRLRHATGNGNHRLSALCAAIFANMA